MNVRLEELAKGRPYHTLTLIIDDENGSSIEFSLYYDGRVIPFIEDSTTGDYRCYSGTPLTDEQLAEIILFFQIVAEKRGSE